MTSKTLSINLIKNEFKNKIWLFLMTLFASGIVPGSILMSIDRQIMWGYTSRGIAQILRGFVSVGTMGILFSVTGMIYSVICFGYLYSRSKVDLYHSLPLKRENMFFARLLSCLIPFVVIDTVMTVVETLIILVKGFKGYGVIGIIWNTYAYSIVLFLLGFLIMTVALTLCGNILVGPILGIGLFVWWPVFDEVITWYIDYCFQTGARYLYRQGFSWVRFILSPSTAHEMLKPHISENPLSFVVLILEVLILLIIALRLYKIRPSECTGQSVCYNILQPVIRMPLVTMAALTGGIYIVFVSGNFMTAAWYWSIFVIVGVLTHMVIASVMKLDFKKMFSDWPQLVVSLVVGAIIAVFFLYDLSGHDRYIPDENKIKSASIIFSDIESEQGYYDITNEYGVTDIEYADRYAYVLDGLEMGDVGAIRQLAQVGIDNIDQDRSVFRRQEKQRELNNMSYEEWSRKYGVNTESCEYYTIKYTLNNGRTVYRAYNAPLTKAYAPIEAIYNSDEYKDAIYQIDEFRGKDLFSKIEINNALYETLFKLDGENIDSFLEAYSKDLKEVKLKDLVDNYPIYRISSARNDSEFGYMDMLNGYYIYPGFKNTLAFLSSKGMEIDPDNNKIDERRIERIEISDYSWTRDRKNPDSNTGGEDVYYEPSHVTYVPGENDDIIKEIASIGVFDGYAYVNSIFKPYENGLDIVVSYQTDRGYANTYYLLIPKDKMPKKLIEDLEKAYNENDSEGMIYDNVMTTGAFIE